MAAPVTAPAAKTNPTAAKPETERKAKSRSVFAVDLDTAAKIKAIAESIGVTPRKIHGLALSEFVNLPLNQQKQVFVKSLSMDAPKV